MDEFKEKFVEEANDFLQDLEKALLVLENDLGNKSLIEQIFRIMHTLKGNSAMFGFHKIDEFTHQLETVYDLVRNEKLAVSRDLIDLTLASVDHLNNLLDEENERNEEVQNTHKQLLSGISKIIENFDKDRSQAEKDRQIKTESPGPADREQMYYIFFEPDENILDDGTNPLYLLDELHTLGECRAIPFTEKLPELKDIDTKKCYVNWEIFLATKESEQSIKDVFMFVENDCTLGIHAVSDRNLFSDERFTGKLDEILQKGIKIGPDNLKSFISTLERKKGGLDLGEA